MSNKLLETCKNCDGEGFKNEVSGEGCNQKTYTYVCQRCSGDGEVKWTSNILKRGGWGLTNISVGVVYRPVKPVEYITVKCKIGGDSYDYYDE